MAYSPDYTLLRQKPLDPLLDRILELMCHNQSLVGSLPSDESLTPLYQHWLLEGLGLMVVVCEDSLRVAYYQSLVGLGGDSHIAFLSEDRMPHQIRAVYREVQNGKVRLLFITAYHFTRWYQEAEGVLVIKHLMIEGAHRVFPEYGPSTYEKLVLFFQENTLSAGIGLLCPPLSSEALHRLGERFCLKDFEVVQKQPAFHQTDLSIIRCFTSYQKLKHLETFLHHEATPGDSYTMIWTWGSSATGQLQQLLMQKGFSTCVSEPQTVRPDSILIADFTKKSTLQMSVGMEPYRIAFWQIPPSLEEVIWQFYRSGRQEKKLIRGLLLYTKEDYLTLRKRLSIQKYAHSLAAGIRIQKLKALRNWVLSETCQVQSLLTFMGGDDKDRVARCGGCPACTSPLIGGVWGKFLKHWLY